MSLKKIKYGVTEVFVKHDFYISLRIRLVDNDGYIYLNKGDKAVKTNEKDSSEEKRHPADKVLPYKSGLFYVYCEDEDLGAFPRYKYILHEGSSRSSKSWSLEEWAIRECEKRSNFHINIWRDTREALSTTIWKDFRKLIPLSGRDIKLPRQTTSIYFPNGSVIEPKGTDANNAHGATSNIAWLNEPYGINEEEFDQIDQRANQIIIDLNPLPLHWLRKVKNNPRTKVIYSTFERNPFCPDDQRAKILSYEPWERGSYQVADGEVYYNGKIVSSTNQPPRHEFNHRNGTADEYNWTVYGLGLKAEKPKKIYKGWKPITLDEYESKNYDKYYGLDYGFVSPSALVEVKFDGDRTFYVKPLLYKPMNSLTIPLGEALLNDGVPSGNITYLWADSADKDRNNDLSLTNDLRQNYGINAVPTRKPSYKARFEFISKARVFFVHNEEFEHEYDNYEFEVVNGFVKENPIKKDDHYMNALEYCIWGIKEYLNIMF